MGHALTRAFLSMLTDDGSPDNGGAVTVITAPASTPPPPTPAADPDLGDAGKRAIAAERKRASDAEKALKAANDRLAEFEQSKLSELERAQKATEAATARAAELEQKLAASNRAAMAQRVAETKGLPIALAGRLQGDTEEELAADADHLVSHMGSAGPRRPAPDPGQGSRDSDAPTGVTAGSDLYSRLHNTTKE